MEHVLPIQKYILWFLIFDEDRLDADHVNFRKAMAYHKMQHELEGRRLPGPIRLQKWEPDPVTRQEMEERGETRYYYTALGFEKPPADVPLAAYAECASCGRSNVFVIATYDDVGVCEDCRRFRDKWPEYVRPLSQDARYRLRGTY